MSTYLHISFDMIYERCLYSSIAHAVGNLRFPFLSYEQSWDNMNYGFRHGAFNYGTITFDLPNRVIVGAFRDEKSERMHWYPGYDAMSLFDEAPEHIKFLAKSEALQYQLLGHYYKYKWKFFGKGKYEPTIVVPVVTTALWGEGDNIYSCDSLDDFLIYGGEYISDITAPFQELQVYWQEYYDFVEEEMKLVSHLFEMKKSNKMKLAPDATEHLEKEDGGYEEFVISLVEIGFEI